MIRPYLVGFILLLSCVVKAERPNIILIIGDDVGYSDLGAFGGEIDTPNLDALAMQGVRFSNFHVTASCSPTRSMLLTGVDNHKNGLGNMTETMPAEHAGKPGYDGVLNDKVVTIADMLKANGYHTYHVGKWHLGKAPNKRPYNRGYERTIALANTGADNWEQKPYMAFDDAAHWYADGKEHQLPDDFYSSKYFVDKAIEFIDSNKASGKPFFSTIGFQAVHIPLQAPREFVDKYMGKYKDGWEPIRQQRLQRAIQLGLVPATTKLADLPTTKDWNALSADQRNHSARRMAVFAGMLDAMDHHVGRLVNHLKAIGEYDNTVFIFVSDNGPEPSDPTQFIAPKLWLDMNYDLDETEEDIGEKGTYAYIGPSWASAGASPGNLYKFFAGEGGVRVPMFISWPKQAKLQTRQQTINQGFAHVKDIVPTLLGLSNTPNHNGQFQQQQVEPITGVSLLPMFNGQAESVHPKDKAIGYELSGNAALYKGDYKLMKNLKPLGDGQWHLYNITQDQGETTDLKDTQPALYQELLADYQTYAKANGVLPMPEGYHYMDTIRAYGRAKYASRTWWMWLLGLMALLFVGRKLVKYVATQKRV